MLQTFVCSMYIILIVCVKIVRTIIRKSKASWSYFFYERRLFLQFDNIRMIECSKRDQRRIIDVKILSVDYHFRIAYLSECL